MLKKIFTKIWEGIQIIFFIAVLILLLTIGGMFMQGVHETATGKNITDEIKILTEEVKRLKESDND